MVPKVNINFIIDGPLDGILAELSAFWRALQVLEWLGREVLEVELNLSKRNLAQMEERIEWNRQARL